MTDLETKLDGALRQLVKCIRSGDKTDEALVSADAALELASGNPMWGIRMIGRLGYGCTIDISAANAKTKMEAESIAQMMFPELYVKW